LAPAHDRGTELFLTGTLLNVAAVVLGTTVGLLIGSRLPKRIQESLTDGLGLFTLVVGFALSLTLLMDRSAPAGSDLAVLAALLAGVAIGELLRLSDRLDALGDAFQRRLARGEERSRISEAFVTASLVFCVGPLTVLGSIQNGLTGDIQLLAVKSLLDGVASIAFAAALGAGVYLSAVTVLVVQGLIALGAFLMGGNLDPAAINAASAVGGILLLGVGLRLLEIKRIRVVNFLPALLLAPLFVWLADAIRRALAQ
jgi:uncharacterized membrane protein YqgA involved in biofilm formation